MTFKSEINSLLGRIVSYRVRNLEIRQKLRPTVLDLAERRFHKNQIRSLNGQITILVKKKLARIEIIEAKKRKLEEGELLAEEKIAIEEKRLYRYTLIINRVPFHGRPWRSNYCSFKVWVFALTPFRIELERQVEERMKLLLNEYLESSQYANDVYVEKNIENWREVEYKRGLAVEEGGRIEAKHECGQDPRTFTFDDT